MRTRISRAARLAALAVATAAASAALVACGGDDDEGDTATADAAEQVTLTGEETILALDSGTAKVLKQSDVAVEPVNPASAGDDGIVFPITGGEVELETLAGTIDHSGGLRFSSGGTDVELNEFVVDTVAGTLTSTTADGAELATLDLDLEGLDRGMDGDVIVASRIQATLTGDAAAALNDAFGVDLFERGLEIGEVTVRASA